MEILKLANISKTFGHFKANDKINFAVKAGEVHAVLGENGAGKSTLMNVIFGLYRPDAGGKIFFKEKEVQFKNPREAIALGIGMVHQHFMLIKPFSVLENIILGVEHTGLFNIIDKKKARTEILELSKKLQFEIDLDSQIDSISLGMQQRVEILKTLYRQAELIILDEPTAVLTPQEIHEFYRIIHHLKAQGKTIIIITHKLKEIKAIADRCTILRRGQFIETVEVPTTSEKELAAKMVGRDVVLHQRRPTPHKGEVLFSIEKLSVPNSLKMLAVKNLSMHICRGEIYGLAGIDGNGQSELVDTLMGLKKSSQGHIYLNKTAIENLSPQEIYEHKLSVIPPDRKKTGLILDFSVKENFLLQRFSQSPFSKYGVIINKEVTRFAQTLMERFDIRPRNENLKAANLSGGNQQKIILAREIERSPEVLVAFQPTRGLDVGAIEFVHRELIKLRDEGKAILLISYELDEVIQLSDRLGVLLKGEIVKEFEGEDVLTSIDLKESIGLAMTSKGI